ncbi:MAG TPA: hypothetical protein VLT87_22900 [Thermoanaerobaculia bacterium]|nr:hypothetical protein [Thermoanaerobaculia bacterium]
MFVAFALVAGLAKLVFDVALLPVTLAAGFVKVVVVAVLALIGLTLLVTVGPVLLAVAAVLAVVFLPLLILGGMVWAVFALVF